MLLAVVVGVVVVVVVVVAGAAVAIAVVSWRNDNWFATMSAVLRATSELNL